MDMYVEEGIKRISNINVGGKRMRGRPQHRWMDTIRSDIKA